jgi:hypothetical protein
MLFLTPSLKRELEKRSPLFFRKLFWGGQFFGGNCFWKTQVIFYKKKTIQPQKFSEKKNDKKITKFSVKKGKNLFSKKNDKFSFKGEKTFFKNIALNCPFFQNRHFQFLSSNKHWFAESPLVA